MRFKERAAKSGAIKPWHLFALIAIIFVLFFTSVGSNLQSGISQNLPGNKPSTAATGLVSVQKTVQFTCFDALAGSNCGAVTIAIFQGSSSIQLESLTASSSGVATTGNTYSTGTQLTVKISGNSKATEYLPFTVPGMDPNSAISTSTNAVAVYGVTLGAWTMTNTGTGGTTFTSGKKYPLSGFTGSSVTITTNLAETTANAGYKTSYDVTNLLTQYFVVQIDDGGGASSNTQYATITGFPRSTKLGSTTYYQVILPDGLQGTGTGTTALKVVSNSQSVGTSDSVALGAISLQTIGNNNYGGSASFSWAVTTGSLVGATNQETITLKMYYYYDPAYFAINGNGGPNSTQSGSNFTIVVEAT